MHGQTHTTHRVLLKIQTCSGDNLNQFISTFSVSVFGFDFNTLLFADFHLQHAFIASTNHFTRADQKMERIASYRGIKDFTVFKRGGIVNPNSVAILNMKRQTIKYENKYVDQHHTLVCP